MLKKKINLKTKIHSKLEKSRIVKKNNDSNINNNSL